MKIHVTKLLIIGVICISGFSLSAQPFVDLLHFRNNFYANSPYMDDPNASVTQRESYYSLFLPLKLKSGDVFFMGFDCVEQEFRYDGDTTYTKYLNSEAIPLGWVHVWKNRNWKTSFILLPRLGRNIASYSTSDFQLGGVVLMTYQKSKQLKYKFGVYYNREFYGNSFLPLLGIDWKLDDHTYIYGVLPGSLNLEYRLAKGVYTGLAYKNVTATFRLNHGPDDYYVREGHTFLGDNHLSLFLQVYPLKNLMIYGAAGMTVFRRFQLYDGDHNKLIYSQEAQKAFNYPADKSFFQLGAAFRIRMDKDYID
jgi:hypothetical protein